MNVFTFDEYTITDTEITPTSHTETYQADTIEKAIQHCLYTHRLADGNARLGPTGLVVYTRNLGYVPRLFN